MIKTLTIAAVLAGGAAPRRTGVRSTDERDLRVGFDARR